jgi:hypothetical protein
MKRPTGESEKCKGECVAFNSIPYAAESGDRIRQDPSLPEMARKPWSTPHVIVSDMKLTKAHVYTYTDGTAVTGYQYGS